VQVVLCAFNAVLLALSVMNWRKRRDAEAKDVPAAGEGQTGGGKAAGAAAPAGLKQRRGVQGAHGGDDVAPSVKAARAGSEGAPALALKARAA
jgi:hypothetical protein